MFFSQKARKADERQIHKCIDIKFDQIRGDEIGKQIRSFSMNECLL